VATHKLRCAAPRYDPGGGGINVARAVHALGSDAVAIFPAGGAAGEMIRHMLDEEGVAHHPVAIAGFTLDGDEPFNMAYLAIRGAMQSFGVSRLHGHVSRRLFQALFPGWPEREVPVGHVTNGVHVPSWDSPHADQLWTAACGKERWRGLPEGLPTLVSGLADEELWAMAGAERQELIQTVRIRLARQLASRGNPPEIVAQAANALDPNTLTLGFARRFTGYKRPNFAARRPGAVRAFVE
jgi:alpha-glucan phosphorylase-like protein